MSHVGLGCWWWYTKADRATAPCRQSLQALFPSLVARFKSDSSHTVQIYLSDSPNPAEILLLSFIFSPSWPWSMRRSHIAALGDVFFPFFSSCSTSFGFPSGVEHPVGCCPAPCSPSHRTCWQLALHPKPRGSLASSRMPRRGRLKLWFLFSPFFLHLRTLPLEKKKERRCWPWQAGWGQPVDGIRRTVTGITLQLSENYCGLKQAALSLQPGSQVGSLPSWRRALLGKAPRVFSSKRLKWGKQHWWLDSHLFI